MKIAAWIVVDRKGRPYRGSDGNVMVDSLDRWAVTLAEELNKNWIVGADPDRRPWKPEQVEIVRRKK